MRIPAFIAALAVLLSAGAFAQGPSAADWLPIAVRGAASEYALVLPESPSPSETYAAEEFRDWTERLTGVRLPIVRGGPAKRGIRLNPSRPDAALGEDGFELSERDGDLVVSGGSRGILYGVYEILERFGGVVWLAPGKTHVPEADALRIPAGLKDRQVPSYADRLLSGVPLWGTRENQDFAARMRLNRATAKAHYGWCCPTTDRVLGLCHTFLKLVPPEKYRKDHPEYYSLVGGKRAEHRLQLCLTNPDVVRIAADTVMERIAANRADPDPYRKFTKYYGVSQEDWENCCECPSCKAVIEREGSPSGLTVEFVNGVADLVASRYPDVWLTTLAYGWSRNPPKTVRPRRNVMICLCSIECDFTKPIAESRCRENVDFRDRIRRWHDLTDDLYVWDYMANWRATPSPMPNLRALADNIRFFHENGATHIYEEGIDGPWSSMTDLKSHVAAKRMWNVKEPVAPLIRRFCRAYYGKAAPQAIEFLKLTETFPIDETESCWPCVKTVADLPFDDDYWTKADRLARAAEDAAGGESEMVRTNVAWFAFGIDYTIAARYAELGAWKPAMASRSALARLRRGEFGRNRDRARRVLAMLAENPKASLSSPIMNDVCIGEMRALARAEFPKTAETATLGSWAIDYDNFPKSATISRVGDPDALDGQALECRGEKRGWQMYSRFATLVALDDGAVYALRIRAKVAPHPDAGPDDPILEIGLFNRDKADKGEVFRRTIRGAEATDAYRWYDLGEWTAKGNDYQVFVNARGAHFRLDRMEIVRK